MAERFVRGAFEALRAAAPAASEAAISATAAPTFREALTRGAKATGQFLGRAAIPLGVAYEAVQEPEPLQGNQPLSADQYDRLRGVAEYLPSSARTFERLMQPVPLTVPGVAEGAGRVVSNVLRMPFAFGGDVLRGATQNVVMPALRGFLGTTEEKPTTQTPTMREEMQRIYGSTDPKVVGARQNELMAEANRMAAAAPQLPQLSVQSDQALITSPSGAQETIDVARFGAAPETRGELPSFRDVMSEVADVARRANMTPAQTASLLQTAVSQVLNVRPQQAKPTDLAAMTQYQLLEEGRAAELAAAQTPAARTEINAKYIKLYQMVGGKQNPSLSDIIGQYASTPEPR